MGPQCPDVPLAHYEQTCGDLIPAKALDPVAAGSGSHRRLLSPAVSFWAFLAQVLERGSSCRDALRRVAAWWVACHTARHEETLNPLSVTSRPNSAANAEAISYP